MRLTLGHAPYPQAPVSARTAVERVLLLVLCATLLAGWLWVSVPPARVDLLVTNPSSCSIWVQVSHGDGTGTLDLGSAPANVEWRERGVLDRGSVWRFRFWRQGVLLGEDTKTREQLAGDGWHYRLPHQAELERGCITAPS